MLGAPRGSQAPWGFCEQGLSAAELFHSSTAVPVSCCFIFFPLHPLYSSSLCSDTHIAVFWTLAHIALKSLCYTDKVFLGSLCYTDKVFLQRLQIPVSYQAASVLQIWNRMSLLEQ